MRTDMVRVVPIMRLNGAFYRAYYVGMNHAESTLQKGALISFVT